MTGGDLPPDVEAEIAPDEVDLRTERLVLRHWRDADRAPFAAMGADPEVMRFLPGLLTRAQSDALVDRIRTHFAEHGYGLWVVEVDGAFAGFTGLQWSAATGRRALEVGWRLGREHWGQGLATEAGAEAVRFAFEERGLERLVCIVDAENTRSLGVARKLGFGFWQDMDHPRWPRGVQVHTLDRPA